MERRGSADRRQDRDRERRVLLSRRWLSLPHISKSFGRLLGEGGVLATEAARFTYEADALTLERAMRTRSSCHARPTEVAAIVRWAHAHRIPITARGAGTGLAGGATPAFGGIVLSVNRHGPDSLGRS